MYLQNIAAVLAHTAAAVAGNTSSLMVGDNGRDFWFCLIFEFQTSVLKLQCSNHSAQMQAEPITKVPCFVAVRARGTRADRNLFGAELEPRGTAVEQRLA